MVRAEAVGDELQVLFQVLLRPGHADELDEAVGGVVGEPVGLHDREMPSWSAGKVLYWLGSKPDVAAVGVDQARFVEAVAAHHAADGVGDQPLDVFFAVGAVERDLVIWDFGREFVLQAVGVDEEAVVRFFQFLHHV